MCAIKFFTERRNRLPKCDMNSFRRDFRKLLIKHFAKDPIDRYQKISEMRDDLRGVLQEVSGVPAMQSEIFSPRHLEENPVKRAWNWITGKSSTDSSITKFIFCHFADADLFAGYDSDRYRTGKEKRRYSAV